MKKRYFLEVLNKMIVILKIKIKIRNIGDNNGYLDKNTVTSLDIAKSIFN